VKKFLSEKFVSTNKRVNIVEKNYPQIYQQLKVLIFEYSTGLSTLSTERDPEIYIWFKDCQIQLVTKIINIMHRFVDKLPFYGVFFLYYYFEQLVKSIVLI
jgi:hypothetical protein